MKKYIYEMFGTFVLVLFGCGTASILGEKCTIAIASLSFGLAYLFAYCALRRVCPCFLNPIFPLVACLDKKIPIKQCLLFVLFEFIGAILAVMQIIIIVTLSGNIAPIAYSLLASNGYAELSKAFISVWWALGLEVILSLVLALVFLIINSQKKYSCYLGITLAVTYAAVVALGYYFTGGSANPARSFAPTFWISLCGVSLPSEQYWLFLIGPIIGALIAFVVYKFVYLKQISKFTFKKSETSLFKKGNNKPDSKISVNTNKKDKNENIQNITAQVSKNDNKKGNAKKKIARVHKKARTKD